jgi:subtilisin family serine protease
MSLPVRIGVLDSGVNRNHPHVGKIVDGITITADGALAGYEDTLGHGTAVAAVIHHLNPEADLVAVKIFNGKLATSLPVVLRAIDWCLEHDIQVINLSLGTLNPEHRAAFEDAVVRTKAAGAVIVSALEINGAAALPGSLAGVIGVMAADPSDAAEYQVNHRNGETVYTAPPFPRDIPGVPRERNLNGVSFAVARIAARVATAMQAKEVQVKETEVKETEVKETEVKEMEVKEMEVKEMEVKEMEVKDWTGAPRSPQRTPDFLSS